MSLRALITFNAATDQYQESAKNLAAISQARMKLQMEQQKMATDKKLADAKVEQLTQQGAHTAVETDMLKKMSDHFFGQQQDVLDGKEAQIDQAEHQQTQNVRQYGSLAQHLLSTDPDVASHVATMVNPALTQGPDGGMIAGEDMNVDNTPPAVGSLFGGLPAAGSVQPTMTARGVGMKQVTGADVEAQKLDRIQKAKDAGIALNPDEQDFYNKKMGVDVKGRQEDAMNGDISDAMSGKQQWRDVLKKYPTQAKKILDAKLAADMMPGNDTGAAGISPLQEPRASGDRDKFGYIPNEVKSFPGRQGKYKYLGGGKFKRVE